MDLQSKSKKIQDIISRFLSKLAIIERKKMKITKTESQLKDEEAVAQAQEKIKNL